MFICSAILITDKCKFQLYRITHIFSLEPPGISRSIHATGKLAAHKMYYLHLWKSAWKLSRRKGRMPQVSCYDSNRKSVLYMKGAILLL